MKDKDGNEVGTYKLGTDFDEEKDDDGNVVSYVKTIEVPVGRYTVEETLYKLDGTKETVKYSVDNSEAKEGTETEEFTVVKDETNTVEYEDDYELFGDISIRKTIKGDITDEIIHREVERACRTNSKHYFIPCATRGGPASNYPGVYERITAEIDKMSAVMF